MNATVTMPLSEIDTLRNDLAKAQQRVSELESTQKKIKVEIREQYTAYKTSFYPIGTVVPYTTYKEHPHQYINMDEIIDPIRQEEKLKVEENTRKLEKEVRDLTDKYQRTKDEYQKEIKDLKESYHKEVAKLKGEKVDKTKDETIRSLNEKIYKLDRVNDKLSNHWFWSKLYKHFKA